MKRMIQTSLLIILIFLFVGITMVSGANYMYEKESIEGAYADTNTSYISCPSGCTCLGERNALNQGRIFCMNVPEQPVCGVNQLGQPMYCYSDTIPVATTLPTPSGTTLTTTPSLTTTSQTTIPTTGATAVLSGCGADCRCILPDAAGSVGLPLCGGSPVLCNYDSAGRAMYCYALAQQTPLPATSGTADSAPAQTSCSGDCTCLNPAVANQVGLTLCGNTPVLCNNDRDNTPMYCYNRPVSSLTGQADQAPSSTGIPLSPFTILGAVGSVLLVSGYSLMKKH